jgi:excisionase family DNA binding protein
MTVDLRYYTPDQAAELLGVDGEKILAWINSGELAAFNVGSRPDGGRPRWRIAEADLGRFLLARRHPAASRPATQSRRRKQAAGVVEFFS